jgi:hypothetical protein
MFAEDIGLLPRNYFTSLLYDGAKRKDVERRLHELFTQMNTRDLPAPRVVPYFNGGLFTDVTTLPLGDAQLMALTKADEANWSLVDPHIFGSVFQGIMNDAERHASGAHYIRKQVYTFVREKAATTTTDHYKNWLRTGGARSGLGSTFSPRPTGFPASSCARDTRLGRSSCS